MSKNNSKSHRMNDRELANNNTELQRGQGINEKDQEM